MKQDTRCNDNSAVQECGVAKQTTASIQAQPVPATTTTQPEFIRLPKPGTLCPHTGLGRGKLNQMILPCRENGFRPPVKSVCLRREGSVKGVRLISYSSLITYLNGFGDNGNRDPR